MAPHLSLFELNSLVKKTLDSTLEPSYWVVAELSDLRVNQRGHCYVELVEKDNDMVIAKMRGTIWSYTYRNLSTWFEGMTGQALKSGMKVLCNVSIQFHELYGLSANIKDIDANYTLGERAKRRKEIIDQLVAEGVFDMNRMHPLPVVPQRIAIISSPTAAGFGDFSNQLESNSKNYQFNLRLYKAVMQGDGAQESIIQALHQVHATIEQFDLLVIIRGGGSQVDLDCFDNYELATHVAQFPIPVITGIGHERDETIIDLVAHTKMKTPTAVAEFLIDGMRTFEEHLDEKFARLHDRVQREVSAHNQQLGQTIYNLKTVCRDFLQKHTKALEHSQNTLRLALRSTLKAEEKQLDAQERYVRLLNPTTILKRGYTMTTVNGKRLTDYTPVTGDVMETTTSKERITSTISKTEKR